MLKDPVRIHEFWHGLPEDVPKVDAVLGRLGDSRVVLFSGLSLLVKPVHTK